MTCRNDLTDVTYTFTFNWCWEVWCINAQQGQHQNFKLGRNSRVQDLCAARVLSPSRPENAALNDGGH